MRFTRIDMNQLAEAAPAWEHHVLATPTTAATLEFGKGLRPIPSRALPQKLCAQSRGQLSVLP
eukprot:CAMPEP_0184547874 /NCGR_PEP_ID=MMETSP0199_2-20130426/5851_1 /TAXON_ID=1112570 /ORGANISM="Thraustochytrium sp., Strain LLF1b" /LENGTH=62 /DNA_ID=CAMNT_0026942417 /DNA_START=99 /DNA_END=284 /DNA_ORIENTATION=-